MSHSDFQENTVPAMGQLTDSEWIKYEIKPGARHRVLFVGNSITRHGVKADIGWLNDCGMAASALDKDYVHQTVGLLEKAYAAPVSCCIVNAVDFERAFWDASVLEHYAEAPAFGADIVIIRIGENSDTERVKTEDYAACFKRMARFFAANAGTVVMTGLFWRYDDFDVPIKLVADACGYRYVKLDDLGARADCKALDEYEHGGVKKHPNDTGMRLIAERIAAAILSEK